MNQTTPHSSFKKNLWTYAYNISKIICIWILLQTLVFKFWLMPDALAESQEIFRKVSCRHLVNPVELFTDAGTFLFLTAHDRLRDDDTGLSGQVPYRLGIGDVVYLH